MRDSQVPAGFSPLATCPAAKRERYAARAARAHVSYRAAVELMCLSCVSWERTEASRCRITSCALYAQNRAIFAAFRGAEAESEAAAGPGDEPLEVADG